MDQHCDADDGLDHGVGAWCTQHATAPLEVAACHFIKIAYCIINATSSCQGDTLD